MRSLIALSALILVAVPAQAQTAEPVRVRIFAQSPVSEATVRPVDAPLAVAVDGSVVGYVSEGDRLQVRAEGGGVRVSGGGLGVTGREVVVASGPVRVAAGGDDRRYAGTLRVTSDGGRLRLVNHVPMLDYVASVVASEYPFEEIEGVKAQAVLARTYALRRRGAHPTHDVDDHQGSQVYRGEEAVTPVTLRAARETAGEAIVYRGALAEAVYSSSSGGHTADNESAWDGTPLPYLRGVPDPYDRESPDHQWRTTASTQAVHRALSDRFGGRVSRVTVDERSSEGRALRLRLVGARQPVITGPEFRAAVNAALGHRTVRSTLFSLSLDGDAYVLEGGGFGHGVGMSQYGARGQARAGRSYREILAFYFQGTDVTLAPGEGPALLAAASGGAAAPTERPPIVRGSTEARRWPTPRRLVGLGDAGARRPEAAPEEASTAPRRRAW